MHAFILAGGFATRLWPLTEKRAKPLLPLAGKPLITHLVEKIPEEIPVTVSTNAAFSQNFQSWKSQISNLKSQIEILIEDVGHEDEKLGALGAVAKWVTEENIEDDVLLLAGDNYIGFSIKDFLKAYTGKPLFAAHDMKDRERAKLFGTVITRKHFETLRPRHAEESRALRRAQDRLEPRDVSKHVGEAPQCDVVQAFEEKPQEPRSTLVSTGCFVLPKETLGTLVAYAKRKPDNIGGIFEHFLEKGIEVHCKTFLEPWFDIGSFDAYIEATKMLVGGNIIRGEGIEEEQISFEGSVVLGNGSKVSRSTLRDVVLFEDCTIEDCILENCILDNHCVLKGVDLTGKMLREGTELVKR